MASEPHTVGGQQQPASVEANTFLGSENGSYGALGIPAYTPQEFLHIRTPLVWPILISHALEPNIASGKPIPAIRNYRW